MNADALLAYFHFIAMIGMGSMLTAELGTLVQPGSAFQLHRLKRLDGLYGMFAGLTLASGVARVLWGAKGSTFYLSNPVFHIKITLFIVVALISIYPTVQFFKWSKAAMANVRFSPAAGAVGRVRAMIVTQLVLFAAIPFAATLMARGIGLT